MRQAGRYLPEYRAVREKAGGFLTLCKTPELATQVTLQPVDRFGLDAAILFSDILVIPEAMGMELRFVEGEGPLFPTPLCSSHDLDRLTLPDPLKALDFVMETIKSIRHELSADIPLIGFSGSPWTLATYMIEGGSTKKFAKIKTALYDNPSFLKRLLELLAETVADYLNAQIASGAQAVQIFDTWGGVLGPAEFQEFSLTYMHKIIDRLVPNGPDGHRVPVILFAKSCGAQLEAIATTGCDVIGLDWTTDIQLARTRIKPGQAIQGNMDPAVMYASQEKIRSEVKRILHAFGPHNGHVFNLGHGMEPDMDPEKVKILVSTVHEESRRIHQAMQDSCPF